MAFEAQGDGLAGVAGHISVLTLPKFHSNKVFLLA